MFTSLHVSYVMCHMSHVTCHVSRVMYHMSHVMCQISHDFNFNFFFGQSGETSRWRVCYQRGLPRLVLINTQFYTIAAGTETNIPSLGSKSAQLYFLSLLFNLGLPHL